MKIQKGDNVKILIGKDQGRSGKVIKVLIKEGKVLVEGVNMCKRHMPKNKQSEGRIVEIVKPVNISNVMLVCPSCKKATKIGYEITGDIKRRVCKECKEAIKQEVKK